MPEQPQLCEQLLREILAGQRRLAEMVRELQRPRAAAQPTAADWKLLEVLLPAIAEHVAGLSFRTSELFERAQLADAKALRAALAAVGDRHAVGALLGRASAQDIELDGLSVCRGKTEGGRAVWILGKGGQKVG